MFKMVIIFFLILIWIIYAIQDEIKCSTRAFDNFKIKKSNANKILKECLAHPLKCVKWRRCLITAFLCTITIFAIVHFEVPSLKNFLLYLFIIYLLIYISWDNFAQTVSSNIKKVGEKCIKLIK